MVNCSVELLLNSHCFGCQKGYSTLSDLPGVNMLNTEESTSLAGSRVGEGLAGITLPYCCTRTKG
ncbi:hypothetical protein GJAV_G00233320 [Gymnothorax javanicus]|nr:hypothetical protein GJAV_G00233320 [Gymnothorax javanicus]